jgi:NADH:ubiquinone oxidoreductase subunit C
MSDAPRTDAAAATAAPAEKPTLAARLRAHVAEATEAPSRDGHEAVLVPRERWLDAARALRDQEKYIRFIDLTCVDEPEHQLRFEVLLMVYSIEEKRWARLKTRTDEKLPSVYALYNGAHNYEREVYDLFGVVFEGHPKLTRILLPDGWKGHPLRRDEELKVEPVDFTVTRELYKT